MLTGDKNKWLIFPRTDYGLWSHEIWHIRRLSKAATHTMYYHVGFKTKGQAQREVYIP